MESTQEEEKKTLESWDLKSPESCVTHTSYTSVSDDDDDSSLGLLSEEQLESAWYSDSENDELMPKFKNLVLEAAETGWKIDPNFICPACIWEKEPKISPICAREKSSNIDSSLLESTPRIKQSLRELSGKKSSIGYPEEDILNKTVKISSISDDVPKEIFGTLESGEETNLECNMLNVTHQIDIQETENETSLNRTFGTSNILNKTLPTVINTVETHSNLSSEENLEETGVENVKNKTFTESPKEFINKTISYANEPEKFKFSVEVIHSQKMLSRTVTKEKNNKTKKSSENSPNSSWTKLDASISSKSTLDSTLYPRSSISETDFSQTGAKKKIFKSDKGIQRKNFSTTDTRKGQSVRNKPKKILSITNRDLKTSGSSSAFDTNSSMSSDYGIVPEIPKHNVATISRSNFASKRVLPKKAPLNLSFKKIENEPPSQEEKDQLFKEKIHLKNEDFLRKAYKESANLKGYPDYKLSLYGAMKEIEKAKNRRELLDIPTIRLVEEPHTEQRRDQRMFSRLPQRSSRIGRPQLRSQTRSSEHLVGWIADVDPVDHVPPLPLGNLGQYRRISSSGYSRIPTSRQRATNPQAVFGTSNPFHSPVRGRMSTKKDQGMPTREKSWPHKPPFPK